MEAKSPELADLSAFAGEKIKVKLGGKELVVGRITIRDFAAFARWKREQLLEFAEKIADREIKAQQIEKILKANDFDFEANGLEDNIFLIWSVLRRDNEGITIDEIYDILQQDENSLNTLLGIIFQGAFWTQAGEEDDNVPKKAPKARAAQRGAK